MAKCDRWLQGHADVKVLLVEDDLQLGTALNRAFALARLEPVWVRRLREARESLSAFRPALLVLDLGLPDGDGLTLLESLRGSQDSVPVLIMSAYGGLDDRLRGLNGGADDYIVKPFDVPELIARIHAIARRAAGQASPCWVFGTLVINIAEQTVTLDEERVDLSPTEFKLLLALARHRGRTASREELMQCIWGMGDGGSQAALDFQVHNLRRKLGSGRISTRRGLGYRLEQ